MVEDIPYLQLPKEETVLKEQTAELPHIETDAEIDDSLKTNFKELLAEDRDGQMSLYVPNHRHIESQITGQINIDEVLAEWEKTRRAAETALQEAQQRKLESAKARALQEAGDIMGRLADIIPKLDSGFTPKDLLDEEYLGGKPLEEDRAAEMVANMNQLLQQEIDRLSDENAQIDEQLAAAGADRREDTLEDMPAAAHETEGLFGSDSSPEGGYGIEALEALEDEQQENPLAEDAKLPEIDVAAVLSKELFRTGGADG